MNSSINRQLWGWILIGLAGFVLFIALNERFDFMHNAPVIHSKDAATESTQQLLSDLGVAIDTLGIVPFRMQRVSLYTAILDSLKEDTPTPSNLNQENFHLHGWDVIVAKPLSVNESFNLTPGSIYGASGLYRVKWDNSGRVKQFELNAERGGKSHLLGENNWQFATSIIEDIFLYDLSNYEPHDVEDYESYDDPFPVEQTNARVQSLEPVNSPKLFRWEKSNSIYSEYIELELESAVHHEGTIDDRTEIHGVSVIKFDAYNEIEQISPTESNQQFIVFFILGLAILALFIFIEGFGQLFKGKADWKRIIIVALIISICIYGWRFIFLLNFSDLFTMQANFVVQFNQIIYGLVIGIFAAIAYIGWEAYARGEKNFQINLIDAFWRGKFFLNETGSAIIKGFSLAGVLLGITAVYLTLSGTYLFQSDSQFGFSEVMNRPFFLTLNLSVLGLAALSSVAMVGVIYNFFDRRIQHATIVLLLSILLGGFLFSVIGRSFGTSGTIVQDITLFTLLAVPLYSAYKLSGVVTIFSGLWLFASISNIIPYIQSPTLGVALNAYSQIIIAGCIFLFGIAAYRYGPSLISVGSYVPEYEKKLIRTLRFENEMLIARTTQEKLMPLIHPETDEFEIYGYFIPSYEVGGDYFDYVTGTSSKGDQHLTLAVVDVSGKSMRAAMHAVFTSGMLRSRMNSDHPSRILREICPVIFEKTDSRTFITCIIGRYEPSTKTLKLSNAGHCLPILKRNGKAQFLKTKAPKYPLGVREYVQYKDVSVNLSSGDIVLFYSDGFPEAVNEQGERIGFDQILKYVETLQTSQLSAKEICNKIREYIKQFSIERLADDTTILCLKIK